MDDARQELELVFALAGPVGADLQEVSCTVADALRKSEYAVEEISVSALIRQIAAKVPLTTRDRFAIRLFESPEEKRIASYVDAANAIRRVACDPAAVASAAIAEIRGRRRKHSAGVPSRRAYILRSLKRPEEAQLLRRIYGAGFFLIGVNVNRPARVDSLAKRIAKSHNETASSPNFAKYIEAAEVLTKRDEDEAWDDYGHRLRDVFQLCDLFVSPSAPTSLFDQIDRCIRLILGDLSETPWADEQFMFQAFAASLSSGALGRQVGAVLVSPSREVLGIGWNEVPKAGGGLYRAGEHYDHRDIREDRDSVNIHADQIIGEIVELARDAGWLKSEPDLDAARHAFRTSRVMSLLEFGRTSHAEMEAVLAAARIGVSPRGSTLYTTTFPCHQCARLIVTAGVGKVVYIEPYPKSRALELHRDAIFAYDDEKAPHADAVRFEPFLGIAPHRFVDLFSMTTSAGVPRDRKVKTSGERIRWDAKTSLPKVEMLPMSYLDLEAKALHQLKKFLGPGGSRR